MSGWTSFRIDRSGTEILIPCVKQYKKYAKECVNDKQAANVKNIMEDTGFTVEQALDEADWLAEDSNERMTHEEVFRTLKSRVTIPFTLHGIEEKSHRRIYARYRSQGNWL